MSNSQNLSTPNHAWNPDMTYRQDRDRALGPTTNLLEDYADASIVTCWRTYKKHKQPNQRWGQEVDVAVKTSNTIDLIDSNERALDQVIWGITHPSDCHPGVKSIVENPALVDLLLIRHFKAHGGLVLPPLQAARELQEAHEIVAKEEMASGKTWCTGRTMMHYPNWYVHCFEV
ncbi:uncharacterized protein K460DRAFT_339070 [Cucurbitaria berberidis CBS 394.84]|uniref:Uncharacterized protein n=1 Tax=Cucurbitaria berberidis CBS 394.84 TaxID=1168544 RepID=A0A9P4L986_9PLEO|nr:uncharacterized protein K460DRAFT_339070 [Cucurbitaria berberidis CBS 394.84]KAF1846127.1 hypothetical protein K460DRAFT_339070 [Cucurbitaria berberidis CBS 394.84]